MEMAGMSDWDRLRRNSNKVGHFAGVTVEDQDAYFHFFGGASKTKRSRVNVYVVKLRATIKNTWVRWFSNGAAARQQTIRLPRPL